MKHTTYQKEAMRFDMTSNSLRNTLGAFAIGILISSGLATAAYAEDRPATPPVHDMHDMSDMKDMHDMHDMEDMKDMPGMEHMDHMDHSMHQQQLSKRGAIKRSVVSYTVPDMRLVDANGKTVSLLDVTDDHSAIFLNFIFTTCTTICPVMSSTFQQVQDKLGSSLNEVRMVSISIDPENDTPAKLKEYAAKYKAGERWSFLTGSLENSLKVQKAFGVFAGEKMSHKPITFMKAKGSDTHWVRLEGLAEAGQIIDEYTKLKSENH